MLKDKKLPERDEVSIWTGCEDEARNYAICSRLLNGFRTLPATLPFFSFSGGRENNFLRIGFWQEKQTEVQL